MHSQRAAGPADPFAAGHPGFITPARGRKGAGGRALPRPSPRRWTGRGAYAIFRRAGEPISPNVNKSASTRWNGSPAAREFG
jgi:hypothetical protein